MKLRSMDWILAVLGGVILSSMIHLNSLMAKTSTPFLASWIAHGTGTLASLFFTFLFSSLSCLKMHAIPTSNQKAPLWAYLGGIAGAMTVILAAITVNSPLGLAPSLALGLVGQILFSFVCDFFGLLGSTQRRFVRKDFYVLAAVLSGSSLIIFMRS